MPKKARKKPKTATPTPEKAIDSSSSLIEEKKTTAGLDVEMVEIEQLSNQSTQISNELQRSLASTDIEMTDSSSTSTNAELTSQSVTPDLEMFEVDLLDLNDLKELEKSQENLESSIDKLLVTNPTLDDLYYSLPLFTPEQQEKLVNDLLGNEKYSSWIRANIHNIDQLHKLIDYVGNNNLELDLYNLKFLEPLITQLKDLNHLLKKATELGKKQILQECLSWEKLIDFLKTSDEQEQNILFENHRNAIDQLISTSVELQELTATIQSQNWKNYFNRTIPENQSFDDFSKLMSTLQNHPQPTARRYLIAQAARLPINNTEECDQLIKHYLYYPQAVDFFLTNLGPDKLNTIFNNSKKPGKLLNAASEATFLAITIPRCSSWHHLSYFLQGLSEERQEVLFKKIKPESFSTERDAQPATVDDIIEFMQNLGEEKAYYYYKIISPSILTYPDLTLGKLGRILSLLSLDKCNQYANTLLEQNFVIFLNAIFAGKLSDVTQFFALVSPFIPENVIDPRTTFIKKIQETEQQGQQVYQWIFKLFQNLKELKDFIAVLTSDGKKIMKEYVLAHPALEAALYSQANTGEQIFLRLFLGAQVSLLDLLTYLKEEDSLIWQELVIKSTGSQALESAINTRSIYEKFKPYLSCLPNLQEKLANKFEFAPDLNAGVNSIANAGLFSIAK